MGFRELTFGFVSQGVSGEVFGKSGDLQVVRAGSCEGWGWVLAEAGKGRDIFSLKKRHWGA
jgi:hypothetical protein